MLEKNAKISVLRTMIGLGEEIEPHFIVPQNSISNIRQKMGLSERQGINSAQTPPLIPLENSLRSTQPATGKCPHCESMAKNFLYLESLIRNNYNPKSQCGLCYSSLKYLQFVNKSIMQVFGNVEEIVQAAKAFTAKQAHQSLPGARAVTSNFPAKSPVKTGSKKNIPKKRLRGGKVTRPVLQKSTKNASHIRLAGGGKLTKSHSHQEKKINKNSKVKKSVNKRLSPTLENRRKKSHVNAKINTVKHKKSKPKCNRIGTLRIRG